MRLLGDAQAKATCGPLTCEGDPRFATLRALVNRFVEAAKLDLPLEVVAVLDADTVSSLGVVARLLGLPIPLFIDEVAGNIDYWIRVLTEASDKLPVDDAAGPADNAAVISAGIEACRRSANGPGCTAVRAVCQQAQGTPAAADPAFAVMCAAAAQAKAERGRYWLAGLVAASAFAVTGYATWRYVRRGKKG